LSHLPAAFKQSSTSFLTRFSRASGL
jgi:hypothetical protein